MVKDSWANWIIIIVVFIIAAFIFSYLIESLLKLLFKRKEETKEILIERKQDYLYTQIELQKDRRWYNGFCFYLQKDLTKKNYPELFRYKPWYVISSKGNFYNYFISRTRYWFKPTNFIIRPQLLIKAIEEVDHKLLLLEGR